ncbi:MAG: tyrosine-type recombinase/integrase [Bacteroidaceae bacterium]
MFIRDYLKYLLLERNYSPLTLAVYEESLRSFVSYVEVQNPSFDWATVSTDDVRQWIVYQMDHGSAPATVNKRLSALRSFYRYLLIQEAVEVDPMRKIKGPKAPKPLPYFFKESEMDRLLDDIDFGIGFAPLRDKLMIRMFYTTGVRLAELVGLDVKDVDFSAQQLKVTGKRNKQRLIPFGTELSEALKTYLAQKRETYPSAGGALFLAVSGKRISPSVVSHVVRTRLSQVTTLKKKSPHVLRHTFATTMLNHHADLEVVKELLGHDSLATTEVYTHTTFEELKKEYKNAHPRA